MLGYCDARAGQSRSRRARCDAAQRRDPRQLAVRLRPGDRRRRSRARTRGRRPRSRAAPQPARAADAQLARELARRRRAPARGRARAGSRSVNAERRAGARLSSVPSTCALSARRRCGAGARGRALSSARPPSRTGIAAKPVNGSWLAGGRRPRPGARAARRWPPPPAARALLVRRRGARVPDVLVAEDVAVAPGRRRASPSPYWATLALSLPCEAGDGETCARRAQQHPEHEHRRMASRDFISCALLVRLRAGLSYARGPAA